jgi:ABC-type nitrate/sulfonate/bicarbonate transport system ATPase subunit
MSGELITISDLSLVLAEVELLRGFNLTVPKGGRVGITGPSGCGKSTLLRSVLNRRLPPGSKYESFRVDLQGRQRVSYVPQSGGLIPWFSLLRNLQSFAPDGVRSRQFDSRFREILDVVDLSYRSGSFPDELSSGEIQRALVACGLLLQPGLFVADEPLTEVDLRRKWRLLEYWSTCIRDWGSALLLVSHDIDILLYLCDDIIVLDGRPASTVFRFDFTTSHPRDEKHLFSEVANEIRRALTGIARSPLASGIQRDR